MPITGNAPCPKCREKGRDKTGDHLLLYQDGGKYCNRCQYYEAASEQGAAVEAVAPRASLSSLRISMGEAAELDAVDLPSRGLYAPALADFGVKVARDTGTREPTHVLFPMWKGGQVTGYKVRGLEGKTHHTIGDAQDCDLFGMQLDGGRRMVIVTEGEFDAVAARQMLEQQGKSYRVVSLPYGASSRMSMASASWLSEFESVKLAMDMDEAGDAAASKVCELLPAGKCQRVVLPRKDANDMLLAHESAAFLSAINSAKTMTADGIVMGQDTFDVVLSEYRKENAGGTPFMPWLPKLNDMVYGNRLGELDTYTSGSGSGKTQFLRELQYHLAIDNGYKLGVMSLEEPLVDTALGQMSIAANLPLHLPDVRPSVSDEEFRGYWQSTYGTGNYVVYDHFGSLSDDTLISKIRYMASGMGCTHIFLDHLSIVVSEYAQQGDERKAIDEIMSKLKLLTQQLGIWIGLVVHLRKAGGTPFELGAVPSVDDLRGSGAIKQLSNNIYALSRNQQDPDIIKRNTTLLTVLKCRFTGRTGPADLIQYDPDTGRMMASPMSYADYMGLDVPTTNLLG